MTARSPWQYPYVERIIGPIRRDVLDHMIVLSERHLMRVLASHFGCYHRWRKQLSLQMDCPEHREVQTADRGRVTEIPEID